MNHSASHEDRAVAATEISGSSSKRDRIIELNDQFRASFKGGRVQMTPSVYDLDARLRGRALYVLSRLRKFARDGEHDEGVFTFAGYAFEWRIEYGGRDGAGVSSDPADLEKTFRVLTLSAVDNLHRAARSRVGVSPKPREPSIDLPSSDSRF